MYWTLKRSKTFAVSGTAEITLWIKYCRSQTFLCYFWVHQYWKTVKPTFICAEDLWLLKTWWVSDAADWCYSLEFIYVSICHLWILLLSKTEWDSVDLFVPNLFLTRNGEKPALCINKSAFCWDKMNFACSTRFSFCFFNGLNYSLRFWPHSLLARNVGTKVITLSLSNTKRRNHHRSPRWSRWPLTNTFYALRHASSLDFLIITSPESNHFKLENSDWRISRKTVLLFRSVLKLYPKEVNVYFN